MGVLYIDRGFVSINGVELIDVENITVKQVANRKYVPTMTKNNRYKGTVKGNLDINISFSVAVQSTLGTPKLESIDYETQDVALTFAHGADRYSSTGLAFVDVDQSAPGVGTEGKKTFNFLALDIIDQVGNSSLFSSSLLSSNG